MIAVIKGAQPDPCIVYWTGRSGFSVKIHTWCGGKINAGDSGVLQVPDDAKVCPKCTEAVQAKKPVGL